MPKTRPVASDARTSSYEPSTSGNSDAEVLKKLADSILDNQKMLAELMRKGNSERGQKPKPARKRAASQNEPLAPSESNVTDRGTENIVGVKPPLEHGSIAKKSSVSTVEAHGPPDQQSLSKQPEAKPRKSDKGRETRNADATPKKESQATSDASSGDDEQLIAPCEIITTEATSKLDHVPRGTQRIKDPAEIRRLLEEINLGHIPRRQTEFVAWYQTSGSGGFRREPIKSVHQSQKSAYFRLMSGMVLKFNRNTSDRP